MDKQYTLKMVRESGKQEEFGPYSTPKAARDARAALAAETQYLADPFAYGDIYELEAV